MIVSPSYYLKFTLCLQFIWNINFECVLFLWSWASLIRRNRYLKVQSLVYILTFEMSSFFCKATPVYLYPSFKITTVINISKNIGFVDPYTYVLFSEFDKFIFTLLSPLRKATNIDCSLNNASLSWLVQVLVINNLSIWAIFSMNDHVTLCKCNSDYIFERNNLRAE